MKKLIAVLLFVCSSCFASGPKYIGSKTDPQILQEFQNVYQELKSPAIDVGTASTMTITQLNVSTLTALSFTATNSTMTNLTVTTTATVPKALVSSNATQFGQVAMVFVSSASASNSAQVDLQNISNSVYNSYLIVGDNVVPATNGDTLLMRVFVGGTIQSGATAYAWEIFRFASGASATNGSTGDSTIHIGPGDAQGNTGNHGLSFDLNTYNPGQTNTVKRMAFKGEYLGSTRLGFIGGATYLTAGSAIDGFRFLYASGNITSGTFYLYGLRN